MRERESECMCVLCHMIVYVHINVHLAKYSGVQIV